MEAAIYVRQSLDRAGEGAAIARQEAECRELAERNGYEVAKVYSDNDRSASSGKPRPAWTELLGDLGAGHHDVLICWHTDRLYRRLRDLVDLVELAERRSLKIASVKAADIDLSTPAGRMLAGMLGHAARYEVEQKGARQVAANRARAQRGVVGWSRRPFGYDRRGGVVVLVDHEADALRSAARDVLGGATLASVVRALDEHDMPTSTGGRWSVTSLRRALLNPRNAGRAVSLGHDYGAAAWPAIFDDDTADQLRATLTDPSRRTVTDQAAKYLLSGIALCGICGAAMFATPAKSPTAGTWMIYRCPTTHLARRLDLVDEVVVGAIVGRLARPDALDLFGPVDVDTDQIRVQLVETRDRRDGLASLLADGLLSPAATRSQAEKLTEQIAGLERRLADASTRSPALALATAVDVSATWQALALKVRRDIVRTLVVVTIEKAGRGARFDPEQVRIAWRTT